MVSESLGAYLREVVTVWGSPWSVSERCGAGDDATLVGAPGVHVTVATSQYAAGDRLVFEAWLDDELAAHQPPGVPRPVATVACSRPPHEVGEDLNRRLLPRIREFVTGARELAASRRQDLKDLLGVLSSVADRLGASADPGAHTVSVGTFGKPLYASARVLKARWRDGKHIVRWSIDTDPEHAIALAELLGDRAFALYGPNASGDISR